ncbi:MAG TPA: hypothetical protein VFW25_11395 [Silvibacterium sp.]|nr:hypothetical protein [Silvibacterium sp.]
MLESFSPAMPDSVISFFGRLIEIVFFIGLTGCVLVIIVSWSPSSMTDSAKATPLTPTPHLLTGPADQPR